MVKFLTNTNCKWRHQFPTKARISNKFMWRHLLTKFASYKVPPVMVSTHGSVVPLAMFNLYKVQDQHLTRDTIPTTLISSTPHLTSAVCEGINCFPFSLHKSFLFTGVPCHRQIKMRRDVWVLKSASIFHFLPNKTLSS